MPNSLEDENLMPGPRTHGSCGHAGRRTRRTTFTHSLQAMQTPTKAMHSGAQGQDDCLGPQGPLQAQSMAYRRSIYKRRRKERQNISWLQRACMLRILEAQPPNEGIDCQFKFSSYIVETLNPLLTKLTAAGALA